jgi:glycine/D-amino acid oxidase-like deaminating enzyme/nitrite reductase/ring-hydroxylating ferredoxin subunit
VYRILSILIGIAVVLIVEVIMINNTKSYWHQTATVNLYPRLGKNIEIDTLIIGGGITGATCAYCLAQQGSKNVLIEAGGICDGTTGNTTGKVTIQHGIIYSSILKEHGQEVAKRYAKAQTEAVEFIKEVVKKEAIDCHLTCNTAFVYASKEEDAEIVKKEYETAVKLGIDAEFKQDERFPDRNHCMTGFHNQAVFHAVRYVNSLLEKANAKGTSIYCNTKAVKVDDGDIITVTCENGAVIKAKHLVMATQYPIYDGMGFYFTRLYSKRSYGVAVEPEREWPADSYINICEPSRSIRTHFEDGRRILIVVGEGHHTARGDDDMAQHYDNLVSFASEVAGVKNVLANWSAQDYKTPDEMPYIGRISKNSNIFIAAGFGKWGISSGTLSGMIIGDMITRGGSIYEEIFSPARPDISVSPGGFVSEVMGSVGELVKSKLEGCEGIENMRTGEGRVINYEGKKAGLYLDESGNAIILDITCTHMTTKLNFNSAEKTWDCPAHGGRFSVTGKLLEGPPKNPLNVLYSGSYSDLVAEKRR